MEVRSILVIHDLAHHPHLPTVPVGGRLLLHVSPSPQVATSERGDSVCYDGNRHNTLDYLNIMPGRTCALDYQKAESRRRAFLKMTRTNLEAKQMEQ